MKSRDIFPILVKVVAPIKLLKKNTKLYTYISVYSRLNYIRFELRNYKIKDQ